MVDIETGGPVIGMRSMTELGAAIGSRAEGVLDRFAAPIRPIGTSVVSRPDSFERAGKYGDPPAKAIKRFVDWSKPRRDRKALFVARPAAFDWPRIVWYAWTYLGENPFGFKSVCASSWFQAKGRRFEVELPHFAAEDAEIQIKHFLTEL